MKRGEKTEKKEKIFVGGRGGRRTHEGQEGTESPDDDITGGYNSV